MRDDMISVAIPKELYLLLHDLRRGREPIYEVIICLLELNTDTSMDTYGEKTTSQSVSEGTHPETP